MKAYTVTVKVTILETYEVEAETPELAMQNWRDGAYLGSSDTHIDAAPLSAEEVLTPHDRRPQ